MRAGFGGVLMVVLVLVFGIVRGFLELGQLQLRASCLVLSLVY